jgi:tetratricopeptide (TPR) repeat protein
MLRLLLVPILLWAVSAAPALGAEPQRVEPQAGEDQVPPAAAPQSEAPNAGVPNAEAPNARVPNAPGQLTLDELFERLAKASDTPAGKALESEILTRFNKSGSDTVDLLFAWAGEATEKKDYPLALDLLDQVLLLKPDFAEGWNRRATVHYMRDDYARSLADIRQTLAREPRHFGALSGLGILLSQMGQKEQAIVVLQRALAIDPLLDKVKESLETLEKETAGHAI